MKITGTIESMKFRGSPRNEGAQRFEITLAGVCSAEQLNEALNEWVEHKHVRIDISPRARTVTVTDKEGE